MRSGMSRWSDRPIDFDDEPKVDRGIAIGLAASLSLVAIGVIASGDVLRFLNPAGIALVLGGTVAATLVQCSPQGLLDAWAAFREALFYKPIDPLDRIRYLVGVAHRAKSEGRLTLEGEALSSDDPFLRLGLELTVDGQTPDDVRRTLENELRASNDRAWRSVQVFESMGNFAPALGLIGTLIGLIQMLGALHDPTVVGPSMSLALVATLYGAVFANLVFFPIAGKLRTIATERAHVKTITLEGLLSLAKDENPILVEQRLQSFTALAANG